MQRPDERTNREGSPARTRKGTAPDARNAALELLVYCRERGWAGRDPYDALNSRLLKFLPFLDFKFFRLAMTQVVKRSPVNLRPLLLVPPGRNPKGIALFLAAMARLSRAGFDGAREDAAELSRILIGLRSPGERFCWGYNFPWQTRGELVPRGTPNIICSSFAGEALLDAWELGGDRSCLDAAVSTGRYIMEELLDRSNAAEVCFNYTPVAPARIHNANLLGAALLARTARLSGDSDQLGTVLEATRYSVSRQNEDGSWFYGEAPTQKWVDNFHTGFNLTALKRISKHAGASEFEPAIKRGFHYFIDNFFLDDGTPKYYNDRTYPIDIHSVAQALVTLVEFKDEPGALELGERVLDWGLKNMLGKNGAFYFQKHPHHTVKTPFMRWSEAWMMLGLAAWLDGNRDCGKTDQ